MLRFKIKIWETSESTVKQEDSLSILTSALPLLLRPCEPLIKFSLYLSLKHHSLLHCHPLVSSFYPKPAPVQKHSTVPNTPIMYMLRQGEPETETSIFNLYSAFPRSSISIPPSQPKLYRVPKMQN